MEAFRVIAGVPFEAHVGDPNLLAWATVAAYLSAAVGCGLCAWNAAAIFKDKQEKLHRAVWWGMCAVMTFLSINKQLDFQTWFTHVMKALAIHWNLYELAKRSRVVFLAGLATISLGGLTVIAWYVRREWKRYVFLLLGALFIVRFVIVRVGVFYDVHLPRLSTLIGGIQLNWLMEILGAMVVCVAAFMNWRVSWRKKNHV